MAAIAGFRPDEIVPSHLEFKRTPEQPSLEDREATKILASDGWPGEEALAQQRFEARTIVFDPDWEQHSNRCESGRFQSSSSGFENGMEADLED